MQNRRYNKSTRAYRDLVGSVDQIRFLCADFFLGPRFGGFRDAMESPLILDMAMVPGQRGGSLCLRDIQRSRFLLQGVMVCRSGASRR
jgi:hypothetical protein